MSALQVLLKDTFGYDDFRPGQETIIRHVLRHENVLGIMPTGGGKSICYQLP
ncbi:DEAD/DEAH box helicase, partial [Enterococcus faecalis]|uniref:DEAD/DEAH box helicase n=1 Tax=Enterococcus faecalis TaxID=1351 RepID=UPI003CC5351B